MAKTASAAAAARAEKAAAKAAAKAAKVAAKPKVTAAKSQSRKRGLDDDDDKKTTSKSKKTNENPFDGPRDGNQKLMIKFLQPKHDPSQPADENTELSHAASSAVGGHGDNTDNNRQDKTVQTPVSESVTDMASAVIADNKKDVNHKNDENHTSEGSVSQHATAVEVAVAEEPMPPATPLIGDTSEKTAIPMVEKESMHQVEDSSRSDMIKESDHDVVIQGHEFEVSALPCMRGSSTQLAEVVSAFRKLATHEVQTNLWHALVKDFVNTLTDEEFDSLMGEGKLHPKLRWHERDMNSSSIEVEHFFSGNNKWFFGCPVAKPEYRFHDIECLIVWLVTHEFETEPSLEFDEKEDQADSPVELEEKD